MFAAPLCFALLNVWILPDGTPYVVDEVELLEIFRYPDYDGQLTASYVFHKRRATGDLFPVAIENFPANKAWVLAPDGQLELQWEDRIYPSEPYAPYTVWRRVRAERVEYTLRPCPPYQYYRNWGGGLQEK